MEAAGAWKECFENWPEDLPKRGVLVTRFDEQIAFASFMTSEALLLLDRKAPDTVGARQVIVAYEQIAAVKIAEVVKSKTYIKLGFAGSLAK